MSETSLAQSSLAQAARFDELRDEEGLIRPHWRMFAKTLTGLPPEEYARRRASAGAMVRDNGVTYNVYDETAGQTRPWQLDIVPFILSAADWRNIETAVIQRARLADALLGDIYGEKGDPEQALQWYELSADLVDDGAVTEKIASVKRRISDRDHATTAKELGLPAERSQKAKFVFSVLVSVFVVFIAGYVLATRQGQNLHAPKSSKTVPAISAPGHDINSDIDGKGGGDKKEETSSAGSDVVILERIKSATADGASILLALQDPRNKDVTISYLVEEDKQIRPMAARIATSALDTVPDSLQVTVRAMRGGNVIYVASVHRARLNETKQTAWQNENRENPTAWIDYVLEYEWSTVPKAHAASTDPALLPPQASAANPTGATNVPQQPGSDAVKVGGDTQVGGAGSSPQDKPQEVAPTPALGGAAKPVVPSPQQGQPGTSSGG